MGAVTCDIDKRHVNWVAGNLGYMTACLTSVNPPLPFGDDEFDAIFSISIFSHLTEKSQDDFLAELSREGKKRTNDPGYALGGSAALR